MYRRAREMADTRSELVLRLTLQFNHLQLAELPWELMFDGDDFIAASHKNAVSRLLSKTTPSYTLKTPLRVLAVIANPGDLDGFKSLTIEEEKQILSGVLLKPNRERELQFVETKDTLETLGDRLSEFDANVVHFVCHGAEREGQYGLFLADKENHAIHRTVTDFGGCLRGRTDLRLVVLAACFSGTVRARKFLEGIASQLVENYNIPAVLAMQDSIDINQMHRFVQEFYEEFVKAYAIDHAVNKAREVLCDDRPQYPYFAIPVLYTSTSELDL